MTQEETQKVKLVAKSLLHRKLPESYDRVLFREKCDNVFHLMHDYASHGKKWAA